MGQHWIDGYSAHVEIYLLIEGERYEVAQIGPGTLVLRGEGKIPPNTQAKLVIKIDGIEEEDTILICNGVETARQEVQYF